MARQHPTTTCSPARGSRSSAPEAYSTPGALAADLMELLYDELCHLASSRLAHHSHDSTVDPADLVHEAYLRIAGKGEQCFEGPRHLFFAASRAMHDILVEGLRARARLKRGGRCREISLTGQGQAPPFATERLDLALALERLARRHPEQAQVVVLRCFDGLTISETAKATDSSPATVKRRWNRGRNWLRHELSNPPRTQGRPRRNNPCRVAPRPSSHRHPRSTDSARSS